MEYKLIHGNSLEKLKELADNSVDSVVTDPPYELGFMGKSWDSTGIANNVELWKEVLRVLKPGGHLLAFSGTRTYHRMVCAIEDSGFQIRDQIAWVYGSGFPKSQNIGKAIDKKAGAKRKVIGKRSFAGSSLDKDEAFLKLPKHTVDITVATTKEAQQWDGWGTALKPAMEPIVVARKPISEKTIAANVVKYGTGAINIDGCRIGTEGGTKECGEEKKTDEELFFKGKKRLGTEKIEGLGRWPANLIHDGSEEVVALFPETGKASSSGPVYKKRIRKGFNSNMGGTWESASTAMEAPSPDNYGDGGSAARFFYCAKPDVVCSICNLTIDDKDTITDSNKDVCKSANTVKNHSNIKTIISPKDFVAQNVQEHTPQDNADKKKASQKNAKSVKHSSHSHHQQETKNTVLGSVVESAESAFVQNVRCAGNLCPKCGTSIAAVLAGQKTVQDLDTELGQDFITGHKKQILKDNLVTFVEMKGNTDTIPTTQSLNMFFGSVFHAIDSCMEETKEQTESGTCQRFLYNPKANKRDREDGNTHCTVKPTQLMQWLIRLVTPPNGTVLDPFMGSGSTGKAAMLEGKNFIGIDLTKDYVKIAEKRIAKAKADYEKEHSKDKFFQTDNQQVA